MTSFFCPNCNDVKIFKPYDIPWSIDCSTINGIVRLWFTPSECQLCGQWTDILTKTEHLGDKK